MSANSLSSETHSISAISFKYLSPEERAAVDHAVSFILSHRIQNVTLSISDEGGMPYTGPVLVTQDSTSFIFMIGSPFYLEGEKWMLSEDYFELTPSRSYYVSAPWKDVEAVYGNFDFRGPDRLYKDGIDRGIADFHVDVGPYLANHAEWNTLPEWAKSLGFDSLKANMTRYVQALVSHFKGRVHYYDLWMEANAWFGNGKWPMDRITDIIKMEAATIRIIDPKAKICVPLVDVTPESLHFYEESGGVGHSWTTEDFIQRLIDEGVQFDLTGLETRYGGGPATDAGGIDTLYSRLIQLGKFGKPIYIWETGLTSFIDLKHSGEMSGRWWTGTWHGPPTEEKQAEYMVAVTIVALGNPWMVGLKFHTFYDKYYHPSFWLRFDGVISSNGTRRRSFTALQELWRSLKVNSETRCVNGTVKFTGLAGNYTVAVQGYYPIEICVADSVIDAHSTVKLRSTRVQTTTSAMTTQTITTPAYDATILGAVLVAVIPLLVLVILKVRRRNRVRNRNPASQHSVDLGARAILTVVAIGALRNLQ